MKRQQIFRAALIGVCLILVCGIAWGQATTGTILGNIKDQSGGGIPGVTVVATNTGTNFSRDTISDSTGHFVIQYLPVGTYRLEAEMTGFKKFVQAGIVVGIDRNARIDPVLQVGEVNETVEVTLNCSFEPRGGSLNVVPGHPSKLIGVPFAGRYLHLDMIFNQVAERLALACPAALPPAFLARLKQQRVGLIEVDEREVFEHACNVLPLGPASVLSHTGNGRVNDLLRAEGFQVVVLDLTELRRGGGGPRCLTLPLERR